MLKKLVFKMPMLKLRQNMKMIKLITRLITPSLIFMSFFTYANNSKTYDVDLYAGCIEMTYNIYDNQFIKESEERFLQCFPKTFDRFVSIFGYSEDDTRGPFVENDKSYDYIELFFELSESNNQYDSIIRLGINGVWQIDNVAYLQHLLHSFLINNLDLALEEMSKLSHRDLQSFWFFYFDGQLPLKSIPEEVYSIKDKNLRIYMAAEDEFNKVNNKMSEK